MVLGVGILMNVISLSGGIDIMVAALEHVMSKRTAAMIMGITSGFMSFFSSGLGVVFPTLIPTASGLASTLGADAIETGIGDCNRWNDRRIYSDFHNRRAHHGRCFSAGECGRTFPAEPHVCRAVCRFLPGTGSGSGIFFPGNLSSVCIVEKESSISDRWKSRAEACKDTGLRIRKRRI